MSILRRPTAMAPEDTITTRWPSLCSFTAVSTIAERTDKIGWCVSSSTMELEPVDYDWVSASSSKFCNKLHTKLDDDGQSVLSLHAYL